MIGVTERAKEELKTVLNKSVDHPDACLRLRVKEDGELGLGIDIKMEGDQVVEHEGAPLLVAEQDLAESLGHMAIDVDESGEKLQLIIIEKPAG